MIFPEFFLQCTLLQVKITKIQVEYSFNSKNKDGYHLCLFGKDKKPFLYRSKEGQNYISDMFLWLLLSYVDIVHFWVFCRQTSAAVNAMRSCPIIEGKKVWSCSLSQNRLWGFQV